MAFKGPRRGQSPEQKEFQEDVIQIDRVTRVVKGGRRLRFRATVVIGNKKGRIGLGVGKSNEVANSIQKAIAKAKKSIFEIPIYKGTIPHGVKSKFKSSMVLLLPACEGTGLIAGGAMRKVVELAGIKNILSKSFGSSNRINNAKAAITGLKELQRLPNKMTDFEAKNAAPKNETKTMPKNTAQNEKKDITFKDGTIPKNVMQKDKKEPEKNTEISMETSKKPDTHISESPLTSINSQ
ncbi:30S ribosomal protein S5 [Candidatus Peregrinibacteria bacterium]|nr:30S ribosomal protein S5 [Candidatus Peregrinibacteria bacterium]